MTRRFGSRAPLQSMVLVANRPDFVSLKLCHLNPEDQGFSTVPGSERPRYTQGRIIGPCDQSESVRVTIMLRRKNAREFERLVREFERRQTSDPIKPLSSEEFARRFGADSADIQTVAAFAAQAGLQVEETDIGRRIVVLSGTVRNMNKAFGVQLQNCEEGGRSASGARLTSRRVCQSEALSVPGCVSRYHNGKQRCVSGWTGLGRCNRAWQSDRHFPFSRPLDAFNSAAVIIRG
jgi:hypothetical protein